MFLSLFSTLSVSQPSHSSLFVGPPQIAYAKLLGSTLSEVYSHHASYFQRQVAVPRWLPSPNFICHSTPQLAKLDDGKRLATNDMATH